MAEKDLGGRETVCPDLRCSTSLILCLFTGVTLGGVVRWQRLRVVRVNVAGCVSSRPTFLEKVVISLYDAGEFLCFPANECYRCQSAVSLS